MKLRIARQHCAAMAARVVPMPAWPDRLHGWRNAAGVWPKVVFGRGKAGRLRRRAWQRLEQFCFELALYRYQKNLSQDSPVPGRCVFPEAWQSGVRR